MEEDKRIIRSGKWKKGRRYNGQKKNDKRTNYHQQSTTQNRSGNTNPTNSEVHLGCPGRVGSSYSTCGTSRVTFVTNPVIRPYWGKEFWKITEVVEWRSRSCCVKPFYCRNMLSVSWQDGSRVVFNNKCTEFTVKFNISRNWSYFPHKYSSYLN